MASITKNGGSYCVQFADADGTRRTVRLGGADKKTAESVRCHIEALLVARITAQPMPRETAVWLSNIGGTLRDKLARVGLIELQPQCPTVGQWTQAYMESRPTVKLSTRTTWGIVRRNLIDFLGSETRLSQITPADADRFKEYLLATVKLSPATAYKRLQIARQFFRGAIRARLLVENPFADVKAPNIGNPERMRFVSREVTERIIAACPNVHWRIIVALARYGGLRCPSEVLSLRWDGVDWEQQRFRVDSPKTEHHPGQSFRIVPIFPELRPYLEEAWEAAEDGAVYVVPERFRRAALAKNLWCATNLRTTFQKIIRRAGVEAWPKLFQNLRSSRETELTEAFPVHVVAKWLGNSPRIATRHYLQVTEEHYAKAVEKALQNPTQQAAETGCILRKLPNPTSPQCVSLQQVATQFRTTHPPKVRETGLEPALPCGN